MYESLKCKLNQMNVFFLQNIFVSKTYEDKFGHGNPFVYMYKNSAKTHQSKQFCQPKNMFNLLNLLKEIKTLRIMCITIKGGQRAEMKI